MSVADRCNASLIVERNVEAGRGERLAYVTRQQSLSYEELRRQVNRMGHLLRELGVRREERVLLVLDDTLTFPIAFLGALRIGAVPVPVSVREKAAHFRHFIEDSYAQVVVCDAQMLAGLQTTLAGHDLRYLASGASEGAIELDTALATQEQELAAAATHPDDMAFWLYTSGSTGKPKGVVHMHKSLEITCETFGRHVLALTEEDRVFSTSKLYHSYGLGNSLSYPLYFGASAVLLEGTPTPDRLLDALRQHRPSVYYSVPALYRQLLDDPAADGALDSVRLCVSAAEPLPLRAFERWRDRFGLEILDGIGATEIFTAYCSNMPGEVVPGTTGRAVPGYRLRLADEAGNELEGPAVGTLEVRGGSRAAYYWHQHEQSTRSMRGEWFVSGDRFRRDEQENYTYVGRVDDMLKLGGLWVSPVDMEQALLEHPAVAQVGVVGATIGEYDRLAAFVKCEAEVSADAQLEGDLRSWCKERLRDYEYPHVIRFIDELPQTLTGKPQRFKLREMVEHELAAPERPVGSLAQTLSALPPAEREQAVMDLVLAEMAVVLGESLPAAIDTDRVFEELGFDSLTGVELRTRLGRATELELDSTLVFDHPTPAAVAALLRARLAGGHTDAGGSAASNGHPRESAAATGAASDEGAFLASAIERVTRAPQPPPMPSAPLAIRAKTSSVLHGLLPARLAVSRAARQAQTIWERNAEVREDALAAMETVVAGTPRTDELEQLARQHFIERNIDRALFWQRPWSAKVDALSALRLREALAGERGVLLSACHTGQYYRLQCAAPFDGRISYMVPGEWFFAPLRPGYWGRRLARWHKGMHSRPVPAKGSFRVIQALLERGDSVFLFFDMPGPRETHYLGKSAMLAEGSAQLAVRADALVLPVRTRRAGHGVWVDVAAPLDPRELAGVDRLHTALAARHEHWILEDPAAMEDPRQIGWEHGATPQAWVQP